MNSGKMASQCVRDEEEGGGEEREVEKGEREGEGRRVEEKRGRGEGEEKRGEGRGGEGEKNNNKTTLESYRERDLK
jgi:hypothetical protein